MTFRRMPDGIQQNDRQFTLRRSSKLSAVLQWVTISNVEAPNTTLKRSMQKRTTKSHASMSL